MVYIAQNVYSLSEHTLLLTRGTLLIEHYRKRLLDLGYAHIYVVDKYTEDLKPVDLVGSRLRAEANEIVFEILSNQELVTDNDKMDQLRTVARDMVAEIVTQGSGFTLDLTEVKTFENYVYLHSVNVAAMGILVGRDLKMRKTEMEDFAVGAMLHDIGKVHIPFGILAKAGPLDDEEYTVMKKHTREGFELLSENNLIKPRSQAMALNHHESFDGTGYPLGIKGKEIHIFSRIARVCDVFDALTSDRPYKGRWNFNSTIKYMTSDLRVKFDEAILRIFLGRVPNYSVGSMVKLNTGEEAVVVRNNFTSLKLPVVRIVKDSKGREIPRGSREEINLEENMNIRIALSLDAV